MRSAGTRPTAPARPARRVGALALLGVLALLGALAACAPSGRSAPTTTSAPSTTPTTPTTTVVRSAADVTAPGAVTTAAAATVSTAAATTPAPPATATTAGIAADAPATGTPPLLAELATDPTGLAEQVTTAIRTILDPDAAPEAVAAAGRRQQLVYRRLAGRPEWREAALAATADDVRPFVVNDLAAADAPGDRTLARPVPPLETLPAWTIRDPLPADELLAHYREAEAATGIPWPYLAAINLVETRMGRIVGLSSADAIGPMQFLRSTWDACCTGDPTVDRDAILGAATYLRRRGGPADMTRAVLGYNPNDAYRTMVERYVANLSADERLYRGYHAWEVFVSTTAGPLRLPVGYATSDRIPATEYVAAHPEDRA